MPSKETPSGSCEKTGGGEWTALREALGEVFELIESGELVRDCSRDGEPDWLQRAAKLTLTLKKAQEALAAAAPAPPDTEDYPGQAYVHAHNPNIKRAEENALREPPQLTQLQKLVRQWRAESALEHDQVPDERRDEAGWEVLKGCADVLEAQLVALSCKYGATLAPPQDGQGAELLGPPRGGSSSDLAAQLAEVRATLVWLLENQPGTVWCNGPDESNGVNCTACNARTWKEGETLVHMPECQFANALALAGMPTVTRNGAVAGNASAPVGVQRTTFLSIFASKISALYGISDDLAEQCEALEKEQRNA